MLLRIKGMCDGHAAEETSVVAGEGLVVQLVDSTITWELIFCLSLVNTVLGSTLSMN